MASESSPGRVPVFTVVIPTHDRPLALRSCLETLGAQHYPRDAFEVVVVDDGSRAPLEVDPVVLEGARLELIRQEQAGPAAARNCGAAHATGRYLAFLDDDCLAEPGWLAALEAAFERHPVGALLGGTITNPHPENVNAEVAEMILAVLLGHYRPEPGGDYFFRSTNLAVNAGEFRAAGGFDPAFGTAEDRELCDRWLQRGGSLVPVPAAVVAHASELTFRLFVLRHFRYGRGAYRFHRLRRKRGSGGLHAGILGFYAAVFSRCFAPPLRRIGPRVAMAAAWQLSNAAGFLAELVRSATTDR